jgi:signal transduction histidine kinase
VALTMHRGRARDQLGAGGEPGDLDRARDLMAAAQQDARAALTELRDLARGIHPPALDAGLEDALASLAGASATPAAVTAAIPVRPTPAIETIAYFCAAELLANVAKHSRASRAAVDVTGREETLVVMVTDDGDGGARVRPGGGLDGLAQRVGVVDGTLDVVSPAGGPTVVTITLPLRA